MRPIVLLAFLLCPSLASALSMTVAEQPQVVRQTYEGGAWTEVDLRCDENHCNPVFRVGEGRRTLEFPFSFDRTIDLHRGYVYFAGPGDGFSVKLPVECLDEDLAMVEAGIDDDVGCLVELRPDGNVLKTGDIVVRGSRSESRELGPVQPPGVERYPVSMVFTGWLQAEPKAMDCTDPDRTWPVSAVYEIEASDAGAAWAEQTIAVRVPCSLQTVLEQGGSERLPYARFDQHRVTVSRVSFHRVPELEEFGPTRDVWLVTDVVRLPKE